MSKARGGALAAVGAALLISAPPALAGWGKPFAVSSPTYLDLEPPQLAISARGAPALVSGTFLSQDLTMGSSFVAAGHMRRTFDLDAVADHLRSFAG